MNVDFAMLKISVAAIPADWDCVYADRELLAILCAPRISGVSRSKRNRNAECLFWSVEDAMKDAMLRSCQHMNRCNVQRYKTVSMTWRHVIS